MVYGGKWNGTVKGAAIKSGIVNQGTRKVLPLGANSGKRSLVPNTAIASFFLFAQLF